MKQNNSSNDSRYNVNNTKDIAKNNKEQKKENNNKNNKTENRKNKNKMNNNKNNNKNNNNENKKDYNKNNENKSKNYSNDKKYPVYNPVKYKEIELSKIKHGDFYSGDVKILRKSQPGPVIFLVTDATSSVDAVIKDSDFETDEVINIKGKASERAGKLQIEIDSIKKSEKDFDKIIEQRAKPIRTDFSIKSDRFEKMKPHFIRVAQKIRRAVMQNQPIMIRHHNDSDGINSGLAIEQSIKGLMRRFGISPNYNLYRSPSKAPFYETGDVFKDITMSKRLTEGHGQKKPLVLVLDNGSTPEDVFGMKTLYTLGYDIIVIDHHNPVQIKNGKSTVCPYLIDHINPYLYELDSQTSAGMLCYEIGRMIDEEFENKLMPAIAAISDRCNIDETEEYIKKTGKTREELGRIGVAIDFIAYNMRFDPGKGLFEEVYVQPEFVNMINEKVLEGEETQLQSTLPYLKTQKINGITYSNIDLEKYTLRFTYPTPGKVIGKIHDRVETQHKGPVLSIGYLSDMLIIRANQPVLPVQKIIDRLQKDLPQANVDGGGHEQAGAIKFVSAHLQAVLQRIKVYLREVKLEE